MVTEKKKNFNVHIILLFKGKFEGLPTHQWSKLAELAFQGLCLMVKMKLQIILIH